MGHRPFLRTGTITIYDKTACFTVITGMLHRPKVALRSDAFLSSPRPTRICCPSTPYAPQLRTHGSPPAAPLAADGPGLCIRQLVGQSTVTPTTARHPHRLCHQLTGCRRCHNGRTRAGSCLHGRQTWLHLRRRQRALVRLQ
eukprot:7377025-Prymnesium_polylepis.2